MIVGTSALQVKFAFLFISFAAGYHTGPLRLFLLGFMGAYEFHPLHLLRKLAFENQLYGMVINNAFSRLASIEQEAGAYFVYDSGCSGTILMNCVNRCFGKYLTGASGIFHLMTDIGSRLGTVIMIHYTLDINSLPDCSVGLQLEFLPSFRLPR